MLHLNRGVATRRIDATGESSRHWTRRRRRRRRRRRGEEWVLGTADASARIDAVQRAFLEELEGTEAEQRAQTRYLAFLEACLREAGLYASEEMLEEVATAVGATWLGVPFPLLRGRLFRQGGCWRRGTWPAAAWPHGGPGSRGVSGEGTAEGWVKDEPRAVVYMRYNRKGAAEASKERNTTANSWSMEDVAQWVQRRRGGS